MKLQCAQEALAEALATVGRVVPGKTTLPVLTNVLLEADPGDGLRVVATNLDLTVSRRVRATVSTAARTTVPLSGDAPEQWEFQARAVKRDQEIGLPSPLITAIIRN